MTLPDDARAQLRTYFDALVPPRAVDDAVQDVADRFTHRSPDPPALFATAHTVLEEYGRVSFEVEVDVLVHDLELGTRHTAIATGRDAADVVAALETVAAAADDLGVAREVERDVEREDSDEILFERPGPQTEPPAEDLFTHDESAASPATVSDRRAGTDFAATREPAPAREQEEAVDVQPAPAREQEEALDVQPAPAREQEGAVTVPAEHSVSVPSRRGPLLAIFAVFAGIALLVVVASALA